MKQIRLQNERIETIKRVFRKKKSKIKNHQDLKFQQNTETDNFFKKITPLRLDISFTKCLTRNRFALVLRKINFTLDDKFHFCAICIVLYDGSNVDPPEEHN